MVTLKGGGLSFSGSNHSRWIGGVELWQMLRKGQLKNAGDMTLWEQFNALIVKLRL